MDAVVVHRLHFAFTITYHYLFPQLTMGLALIILVFKAIALARKDPRYDVAARFWARIFGINFAVGVVTGIPMEGANGNLQLADFWVYLLNPWALWQYAHAMSAAAVTGAFVITSVGAFYRLSHRYDEQARLTSRRDERSRIVGTG